jgi:lactoylglutathione lyase
VTEIGSLVLFSSDHERTAAFYRAAGIELDHEDHDGGPSHYAVELGPVHFAIYPAEAAGQAPQRRRGGSTFPGFFVESLDTTAEALTGMSAVLGEHEQMPWGCRIVFEDPDGRPVEINQRGHCP